MPRLGSFIPNTASSQSKASVHPEVQRVEFTEMPFGLWDPGYNPNARSSIRAFSELTFAHEFTISSYVLMSMRDVIDGSQRLKDFVRVEGEWSLLPEATIGSDGANATAKKYTRKGPLVPDYLVFCVRRGTQLVPIGAGKSKLPSENEEDAISNGRILGQLFQYLLMLQQSYGVANCFGILSTYNRWRVCWLPNAETDALAANDQTPDKIEAKVYEAPVDILPDSPSVLKDGTRSVKEAEAASQLGSVSDDPPNRPSGPDDADSLHTATELKLHVSPVYNSDDPKVTQLIATALMKMLSTERRPTKRPGLKDSLVYYVSPKSSYFAPVTLTENLPLTFGAVKSTAITHMYLLSSLGRGRDGLTWLAATKQGNCYVVKLLRETVENPVEAAEREAGLWKTLYGLTAFAASLACRAAVVMPWLKPLPAEHCNDRSEHFQLVQEMIQGIADKGYQHMDVCWRHVGQYMEGSQLRVALMDLHDVKEIAEKDKKAAVDEMLAQLNKSAGESHAMSALAASLGTLAVQ